MSAMSFLYTTLNDKQLAEQLAEDAVKNKMAACVNIIPGATSVYAWEGQIEKSQECLLLFKTIPEQLSTLESWLVEQHPYNLSAIITGTGNCSEVFFQYLNKSMLEKR